MLETNGPDNVSSITLKLCAPDLLPIFTKHFNLSPSTGIYHDLWKHASICPIPKKNNISEPENYRPIVLTSDISMVVETFVDNHLLQHLESLPLLSDHQYIFCTNSSTVELLSYVSQQWSPPPSLRKLVKAMP